MDEAEGEAGEPPTQPRRPSLGLPLWRLLAAAWLSGAAPAPPVPAPDEPPAASAEAPDEDGRR